MTSEEMANDEVKKQREQFVQEGIKDSRLAQVEVRQQGSIPFRLFCHVSVHVLVPIRYRYYTIWLDIKKKVVIFDGIFCSGYFPEQIKKTVAWAGFLATIPSCPEI